MSSLKSDNDCSFNIDELLQIETMCREKLELDVKLLSEGRSEDAKYIQQLERDLRNCSEEIGYLEDQLNLRNVEANYLGEHVHSLELKLLESENIKEKVGLLKEELRLSNSERLFLIRKLENKEMELQNSTLCIQKLEEIMSSIALESECEIESMKLDIRALERTSFEAKDFRERSTLEKRRMDGLVEMLVLRFQDSQKIIEKLEKENKELRVKLDTSERSSRIFLQEVEERLSKWLESKVGSVLDIRSYSQSELQGFKEISIYEEGLDPLFSKLLAVATSNEALKVEMENMTDEYGRLEKKLQDELREEKSKAKEEAEDMAQEMAELRYQLTCMLEEECKRRACIEQTSLQRIADLEAQVRKEQKKSFIAAERLHELQKLVEPRSMEIHSLKNLLQGPCQSPLTNGMCGCGKC